MLIECLLWEEIVIFLFVFIRFFLIIIIFSFDKNGFFIVIFLKREMSFIKIWELFKNVERVFWV